MSDVVACTDELMLLLLLPMWLLNKGDVAVLFDDVTCTNKFILVLLLLLLWLLNTGGVAVMPDDVTSPQNAEDVGIRDGLTHSPSEESGTV